MNSIELAKHWTEFLAARKEFPRSEALLEHFNAGTITRICDCGCNSYDLKVRKESGVKPLLAARQSGGGCALSMAFYLANRSGALEFDVFIDADGYLGGVDVSCNGNSEPVPEAPEFVEPPFHVYGALRTGPQPAKSGLSVSIMGVPRKLSFPVRTKIDA